MGSGSELKSNGTASPQEIIDYLDELCAYSMSIGMSYEQYWYGDPKLLRSYVKAEQFRQQRKNNEIWLQGLYVYIAIGNLVPVLNPFSKDHKAQKYLDRPIPLTKKEMEDRENERIEKMKSYMMSLVEQNKGK